MADKEIYLGSTGPYTYDSDDVYDDGEAMKAMRIQGPILADYDDTPGDDDLVKRSNVATQVAGAITAVQVADINNPGELSSLSMDTSGALLLAYQIRYNRIDELTLYAWDATATPLINSPYTVRGYTGSWVAVGGKYLAVQQYTNRDSVFDSKITAEMLEVSGFINCHEIRISGSRIVGRQQPAIADPNRTLNSVYDTVMNILDRLRAHGLIHG